MKSSDEIFQLINSMSDKEKRFFRKKYTLFVADDDGNYIKLFEEISKQIDGGGDYNEKKIKEGDYKGKFLKNLPFHKNYLYNTILNSLSIFHKDSKDAFAVRNLITQAEILSDKMLHEQSLKLLQRAKKTASEKDLLSSKYEIINIERTILKYSISAEDYASCFEDLFKEQNDILTIQKNLLDYYLLNEKVGIYLRTFGSGKTRESRESEQFEKLFKDALLSDIKNAKTFFSRYIFHNLKLQFHLTKNNFEEAYEHASSAVKLWEDDPGKIAGKPDNYIYSLNNLMNTQIRTKNFSEFKLTESKLRNIRDKFPGIITETNKVFIFYSLSVLNLSMYMESVNMENLRSVESLIRNELDLYEEKITVYQRIILYFFLSCSNFIQEDFENCVYWNSKIFSIGKTDLSGDYQCYARIIQLISFYELGYIDSMEYALKSAYHFISKRERVYKYENIIQKYLRKSFRIKTDKELKEMFREMTIELEAIRNDEYEKNAFDAFNIIPWLESRIKNVPIYDVIKGNKKS